MLFAGVTHPLRRRTAPNCCSAPLRWSGGRVFYSDNGSTAVEVALKMAYQFWCHRGEPQRTLLRRLRARLPRRHVRRDGRQPRPGVLRHVRAAAVSRRAGAGVRRTARRRADSADAGKVAAVILEPLVQGAGGMRMHSPEELRDIFEVAQRHGVLFIADEVMTGCRTAHSGPTRGGHRSRPDLRAQDARPAACFRWPRRWHRRESSPRSTRRPHEDVLPRHIVHRPSAGVCGGRRKSKHD